MGILIISPQTKVGELLDTYPQLEEVLIKIAPAFSALKNPVLRRTVGRVATLSQAAAIGGLKVDVLVNTLREVAGQELIDEADGDGNYLSETPPIWFSVEKVSTVYDARPVINSGESPLAEILRLAGELKNDEILEITAPFVPAPVLDMLSKKGFRAFSINKDEKVLSYLTKQ